MTAWYRRPLVIAAAFVVLAAIIGLAIAVRTAPKTDAQNVGSATPVENHLLSTTPVNPSDPCYGGFACDDSTQAQVDNAASPGAALTISCDQADGSTTQVELPRTADGWDFSSAWSVSATDCDAGQVEAVTSLDARAVQTAKGQDDLGTLLEVCAANDPDDVYSEAGFAMSSDQIDETSGALVLCPNHPHAKAWRAAIKRGQADVDLEAAGRLFGDGTYRVGKEIKPGTYQSTDVDGCYWERQNRNGKTIDNYFADSAKRVQVTIRSSDYGFETKGCGTWRPVS